MPEIIFTSRQQVIDFLKARSAEDHDLKWVCPECKTINLGAYYSHGSPCGGCDKFVFPRLNLKDILQNDNEADEIAKEIKDYYAKIDRKREIISDLETEILEEKRELDEIRAELHNLKTCDINKVRIW